VSDIRRRDFITLFVGGVAIEWPLAARAQQPAMPVIGLVGGGGGDISTRYLTAFRRGPDETREDQP
jgi:putative tryptophan/tyrosine transport system substrate-binding protein